jgi:DNA-binding GntR family transcriptional regulator
VSDLTRILELVEQGDPQAAADLMPLVYDELRRLAALHASEKTVQRDWTFAKAWLSRELQKGS